MYVGIKFIYSYYPVLHTHHIDLYNLWGYCYLYYYNHQRLERVYYLLI